MARTAFSGRKVKPGEMGGKTAIKHSQDPANTKTARKKSESVKTPKITTPVQINKEPKQKKRSLVIREIAFFQKSTDLLVRKMPFCRFVRQTVMRLSKDNRSYRFSRLALLALQEAFEAYTVSLLEDSNQCALHANRVTLFPKDINLVQKIGKERF